MNAARQNSGRILKRFGNALRLLPFLACAVLVLALSMRDGRGTQAAEPITEGITCTTADSEGRPTDFTLSHTPERVLVSYPGATELLIDLGLSDRIIGTIAPYGAEPPAYADAYAALPILSAPYVPSREEVVALRPDLIIGWSHHFTPEALSIPISTAASVRTSFPLPCARDTRRSRRRSTRLSRIWGISSAWKNVQRTILRGLRHVLPLSSIAPRRADSDIPP